MSRANASSVRLLRESNLSNKDSYLKARNRVGKTLLCFAVLCYAVLYCAMLCYALLFCCAVVCSLCDLPTVLYCLLSCTAIRCSAVQCCAMQCSTVQCSTVQCNVAQRSAAQRGSAVQCSAGYAVQYSAV
jgi:hypothetical protein